MQKFMYPSIYMRITQGYMTGTHKSSFAIDEGGSDTGKDYMVAPYSGIVKQIYSQYENEVFFESDSKVLFADGTIDYATTMFVHQDSPMAYGMKIGKHYNQGDKIYIEGGRYKGRNGKFASHCHMEFARGKYKGSGWHKNASGYYSLNNAKKPEDCCFIDDSYHILNDNGYSFKNIKDISNNSDCSADQVLYKGSKVCLGGTQIQDIKTKGSLTTFYSPKYGCWLPITPFYRIDEKGDRYANQNSSKGNWINSDAIFTVKSVSKNPDRAIIEIDGNNYNVLSSGLYEVSNS